MPFTISDVELPSVNRKSLPFASVQGAFPDAPVMIKFMGVEAKSVLPPHPSQSAKEFSQKEILALESLLTTKLQTVPPQHPERESLLIAFTEVSD